MRRVVLIGMVFASVAVVGTHSSVSSAANGCGAVLAASPLSGSAPLFVKFYSNGDTSQCSSWDLYYGDGTSATGSGAISTEQFASHTYASAANYTATLRVCAQSVDFGCAEVGRNSVEINVTQPPPPPPPQPAAVLSPVPVSFGSAQANTEGASRTVTVTNNGGAALSVDSVAIGGANPQDFLKNHDDCSGRTVAPGANCQIQVAFNPNATGSRQAVLSVSDNAGGSPQSDPLNGSGTDVPVPAATLTPDPVDFGSVVLGTDGPHRTVTIRSAGTAALTVGTITLGGPQKPDFSLVHDTCSGHTLPPSATCSVDLGFRPAGTGTRSASLGVQDNASDSPQSVTLTGVVPTTPPPPPLPPSGTPTLRVFPRMGPPGTVVTVIGDGFASGANVTLLWSQGIPQPMTVPPVVNQYFEFQVLIFPHDELGPRTITAVGTTAVASFVVVLGPAEPGGADHEVVFRH